MFFSFSGETPLHFAANHASRCTDMLLRHNVKVLKNRNGETPFDIAVHRGYGPTALRLFKYECTYQQDDDQNEQRYSLQKRYELLERMVQKLITVTTVKDIENVRKVLFFFCQQSYSSTTDNLNHDMNSILADLLEIVNKKFTEFGQKLLTQPQNNHIKNSFLILLHTLSNLAITLQSPEK
jgi:hypothetical protein